VPSDSAVWIFMFDFIFNSLWQLLLAFFSMAMLRPLGMEQATMSHLMRNFIPFFIEHYSERFGGVVLIVLGETIDGIAVNAKTTSGTQQMYCTVSMAFLLVLSLKLLYYDCCVVNIKHHVLRVGSLWAIVWNLSHPFLACALAMCGDALALLAEASTPKDPPLTGREPSSSEPNGRMALCYALAAAHILLILISHAHESPNTTDADDAERSGCFKSLEFAQIVLQLLAAGVAFGLAQVSAEDLSDLCLLVVLVACCCVLVALNMYDEYLELRWPSSTPEVASAEIAGGLHLSHGNRRQSHSN